MRTDGSNFTSNDVIISFEFEHLIFFWPFSCSLTPRIYELVIERYVLTIWYRYRDISIYGKGFANEWNSHTIFEIKWDANRDPDQKFSVTFKTNTSDIVDGEQFLGLLVIEYPGRTVNTDLELKYIGMNITV